MPKYILEESLGYLTARVSKAILRRIGATLAERDLPMTPEEFTFLVHLWDEDGQTQKQLGRCMMREKTNIAKLAARVEAKGLIVREAGLLDGREKRLLLTDKGRSVMTEVTALVQGILVEAKRGIPEKELEICKDVLRGVFRNLQRE